jgi:hypothetical protein
VVTLGEHPVCYSIADLLEENLAVTGGNAQGMPSHWIAPPMTCCCWAKVVPAPTSPMKLLNSSGRLWGGRSAARGEVFASAGSTA